MLKKCVVYQTYTKMELISCTSFCNLGPTSSSSSLIRDLALVFYWSTVNNTYKVCFSILWILEPTLCGRNYMGFTSLMSTCVVRPDSSYSCINWVYCSFHSVLRIQQYFNYRNYEMQQCLNFLMWEVQNKKVVLLHLPVSFLLVVSVNIFCKLVFTT